MNKELLAFREGVKWGIKLFSRPINQAGEPCEGVVGHYQREIPIRRVLEEVDEGKWDDVLKNSNAHSK